SITYSRPQSCMRNSRGFASRRRIYVRRDANPLEFLIHDSGREYVMLAEEVAADGAGVGSFDMYVRNGARLVGIKRSVEADVGHVFQTIHPIARKVTQPRFLALTANAVVKQQRFADGQPGRGRVCAYLFELANVRGLF